nr:hypothetical protein [Candidatus Sigynarchaeum springense]
MTRTVNDIPPTYVPVPFVYWICVIVTNAWDWMFTRRTLPPAFPPSDRLDMASVPVHVALIVTA